MTHTQYITTAIAVSLAVLVALALMFFGPSIFRPFQPPASETATSTLQLNASTTMETSSNQNPQNQPASAQQQGVQKNEPLPTTLTAKDIVVGTGATATAGHAVTVNYVGMLPDGTVFDASANHGTTGFTFQLGGGQVIKGWDLGVAGMKVGGKRRLIVPPSYGYGNQAVGNVIPANATLIFDIELLSVK